MAGASQEQDIIYCLDLVQTAAHDLYLADLLLSKDIRADIVVLHAFHVELTRIPHLVKEPMAGEVRLQWWIDVINNERDGEAQGHPVARLLLHVIERRALSREKLSAKVEAHVFDLYNDPMGDLTMFEGYSGETQSILFQTAATIADLDVSSDLADACGHAGVAMSVAGVLRNMAFHRNEHRILVPADLLSAAGLSSEGFLGAVDDAHAAVVEGLVTLGEEHFAKAGQAISSLTGNNRGVFKPLALVPLVLKRSRKDSIGIFNQVSDISQLRKQWALFRGP